MFAHRPSNRQRNVWAVSLLDVQPTDRVLEVGFGPGVAIAEFAARATRGHVFGIDHSQAQPRCPGATRDTTAQAAQELQDVLTQAGFTHLRVETLELDPPVACVIADNPTGMSS
jgi:ubiquinone/menaquinone biosynthesis C-methylase UbiE